MASSIRAPFPTTLDQLGPCPVKVIPVKSTGPLGGGGSLTGGGGPARGRTFGGEGATGTWAGGGAARGAGVTALGAITSKLTRVGP